MKLKRLNRRIKPYDRNRRIWEELNSAITNEDHAKVKSLLENDYNGQIYDATNHAPLHTAIMQNDDKSVELLLEYGADPNFKSFNGESPLKMAVDRGCTRIVELLCKREADVNEVVLDSDDTTLLLIAIRNHQQEIVEILLEYGANVNKQSRKKIPPLYRAVKQRDLSIVKILLEYGANVHEKIELGRTALIEAAANDCENLLKMLLKYANSPNDEGEEEKCLLAVVITERRYHILRLLLDNGYNGESLVKCKFAPLHMAILQRDEEMVKILLEHGADPNAKNFKSEPPLKKAIDLDCDAIVELLCQHDANVNVELSDDVDPTLLLLAIKSGRVKMVETLLIFGADVNRCNKHNVSPLYRAVEQGHLEMVKNLLDHGANIHHKVQSCLTALTKAVLIGREDIFEMIFKRVNHVSEMNDEDGNVMFVVLKNRRHNILKLLLDKGGVNTRMKGTSGVVPAIVMAIHMNNVEAVRMLCEYGVNVNEIELFKPLDLALTIFENASRVRESQPQNSMVIKKKMVETLLYYGANPALIDINLINTYTIELLEHLLWFGADIQDLTNNNLDSAVAKTIAKYYIKRSIAGFKISKAAKNMIEDMKNVAGDELKAFEKSCVQEIEKLKKEFIYRYITFYDFLHGNRLKLIIVVNQPDICKMFDEQKYNDRFPIYSNFFEWTYIRAKQYDLVDSAHCGLNIFCGNYLPVNVIRNILNKVNINDLRNVVIVGSSIVRSNIY